MKLLITTQKVDKYDDNLGFFHQWIREFAKQCEHITVVALYVGEYDLPENVTVYSLGKERGAGKIMRTVRFYYRTLTNWFNYSHVFVHMNPEYVFLMGPLWRIGGKDISMWYTHKSTHWLVRYALKWVHRVFSASKESFRLETDKLHIVGHGIDTDLFAPTHTEEAKHNSFSLLSFGRLSRSKHHDVVIEALKISREHAAEVTLTIVGGPIRPEDIEYEKELHSLVAKHTLEDHVRMTGAVPFTEVRQYLKKTDLFVHLSTTGSVDKVVLEVMSSGIPVISSSEAFKAMLAEASHVLVLDSMEPEYVAERIKELMWMSYREREIFGERLRDIVIRDHSLPKLIQTLLQKMKQS